ncbi:putative mitochondrial protein, partial [Mucuna pruriens]
MKSGRIDNPTYLISTILDVNQQILGNVQYKVRTRFNFKDQAQSLYLKISPSLALRAKGYSQIEGINFTETYAFVARVESIHILLSFAAHNLIRLYQMDVNYSFLNCIINERVYVKQPLRFENDAFLNHVFKLKKTLLWIKGRTSCLIKQADHGIYIHQTKCVKEFLKKFKLDDYKSMTTPMHPTFVLTLDDFDKKVDRITYRDIMFNVYLCVCFQSDLRETHLTDVKKIFRYLKGTTNLGLWFKNFDKNKLKGYYDTDYTGDKIERKNTNGGCHFIGANLVSWACKRQGTIAFPLQKHITYLLQAIAINSSGLSTNLKTTTSLRVTFFYFVIILLL